MPRHSKVGGRAPHPRRHAACNTLLLHCMALARSSWGPRAWAIGKLDSKSALHQAAVDRVRYPVGSGGAGNGDLADRLVTQVIGAVQGGETLGHPVQGDDMADHVAERNVPPLQNGQGLDKVAGL